MFRSLGSRLPLGNSVSLPTRPVVPSSRVPTREVSKVCAPSSSSVLSRHISMSTNLKPTSTSKTSVQNVVASQLISLFRPQRSFGTSVQNESQTQVADRPNKYGTHDDFFEEAMRAPTDPNSRNQVYMLLGSARFIAASAVRVLIVRVVASLSASADVLALGSLEVDISKIPEGSTFVAKWRGKPVFIRHRTDEDISLAKQVSMSELRHAEDDSVRVKDPKWLVVLGVCTHLGCVPINNAGDYKGWFCPCHGSHYDTSGRIRKGPAPLNLEVPTYKFLTPTKLLLG